MSALECIVCPEEHSVISQIIVAFVVGLILSCLSVSFIVILFFSVILEMITFYALKNTGKWIPVHRLSFFCSYILGWVTGRTVYRMKTFIISKEVDEYLKIGWC